MIDEMAVKRALMDYLPSVIYLRVGHPLWLRWYKRRLASSMWQSGSYTVGDVTHWRGVRLVCCAEHYAGDKADHPWDPGWGWVASKANAMWEPKAARDRLLLRLVGDPRREV